jgi:DNA polymerase IIIc chi subunit
MSKNSVIFFTTAIPAIKIQIIQKTIDNHVKNKEKIKLITTDEKATVFLSNVLWTHPKESFLPHSTTLPTPFFDQVLITHYPITEDDYSILFNLSPHPIALFPNNRILYELEDPSKPSIFQEKISFYKNKNYPIASA